MLVLLPMSRLQMPAILLLALQLVAGVAIYFGLSVLLKNESVTMIMKMLRLKKK
jgi:type VI protein secretion system component VasF